jgi:general secretion pathway protein E
MKSLSYKDYPEEPVPLDNLSLRFMKEAKFVPVGLQEKTLKIAMANPEDFSTVDSLRLAYGLDIEVFKGREDDIAGIIDRLYGIGRQSLEMIIEEAGKDVYDILPGIDDDIDHLRDLASEAPIIRLVNRLVLNAVDQQASDIHFEPFEDEFKVRYRIDGVLNDVESPPKRLQAAIISRVKIMAKLDIGERRLPQDGRIKMKIGNKEIDFRVSSIPTLFGESVVMRILDRETLILDLERLGFPKEILGQYLDLISQPYGMILVCGPTGSGKTSTLYTTLSRINSPEKKIITLEDPIEYQLKGVNQIQVNPKIGLSFANGLRSIVRQDPDIILVGEIRDAETAEIAVQSALTGHLLFSTIHTNDACGAITRLLEMGVENFLVNSTLLGVLSQRLVRVICTECKTQVKPDDKLLSSLNADGVKIDHLRFYAGKGCEACRYTGFKGRIGIFEYLPIDDEIRTEITSNASTERLTEVARKSGMKTLREDGWSKVVSGITTVAEVLRVTLER